MKLCDLHCDTPYEMFKQRKELFSNDLHISIEKAEKFSTYIQCHAVWSDKRLSDKECLDNFFKISSYFKDELSKNGLPLIKSKEDLGKSGAVLCVEGARLISNNVDNISRLYNEGVRIMTMVWGGFDSIGGAWDTDCGLTRLGCQTVDKCLETGILPDISHGSPQLCRQVLEIMKNSSKAPIATHSNSLSVCSHRRNISDDIFHTICNLDGICGISLCPAHLADKAADLDSILKHIEYYINLGGRDHVALGCDLDGIDTTPEGIYNIQGLSLLWDRLCRKLGEGTAEKIFFSNAFNYLVNNI